MAIPDYASRPGRTGRPWAASEVFAWCAILLLIATLLVAHVIIRAKTPGPVDEDQPSTQVLLSCRYVVALQHMKAIKIPTYAESLIQSVEKQAKSPADRFRLSIVRRELQGADAQQADLRQLRAQFPVLAPDIDLLNSLYAGRLAENSAQWSDFHDRHGWFADLADVQAHPNAEPLARQTYGAATRTLAAYAGFIAIVAVLGFTGLALLILAIVFYLQGRFLRVFPNIPVTDRRSYLQGFALYLGSMVLLGLALRFVILRFNLTVGLSSNLLLFVAFAIGVAWPLVGGWQSWSTFRQTTGLHVGKGIVREIFCGLGGYIAGLPLIIVASIITLLLAKASGVETTHPIVREVTAGRAHLAVYVFLACVWAPVTEELMFRGMLFPHLRERFGFWMSAISVSIVFAIIHPQGWPAIPVLGTIALVLAAIREWRGSILGSMAAHALNNTVVMVMLIAAVS